MASKGHILYRFEDKLKPNRCAADIPFMKTKLLILLSWGSYFALRQTADDFWRFCLIYSAILAICSFFYGMENKTRKSTKKTK